VTRLKIDENGQITIPRSIREKYGLVSGISFVINENKGKITIEPAIVCYRCGRVLSDEFEKEKTCPDCPPPKRIVIY